MRALYISFYFLLCFTLLPNWTYAAQILGGEITYSCTGTPDEYLVELRLLIDSDDNAGVSTQLDYSSATCGIASSLTLNLIGTTNITQTCPAIINVEERLYSATLTLPMGCGADWVLTYSDCCRSNAITSGSANEGFSITANLDNTTTLCNNSPVFSTSNFFYTCTNNPMTFSQGAVDPDGDMLVYSLVNCEQSFSNSVSYNAGFSGTQPLSTTGAFNIDPSGIISFTPTPLINQVAPICVRVEEYRAGVKIGEVTRDILFVSNLAPVPVPTLGQWGLIILTLLLLTIGVLSLKYVQTKTSTIS